MCEYCGCQDIATIAELTREHDAVVAEISRIRTFVRDGDIGGAAVVARRINGILRPHTLVEERGLFPHLALEFPEHVAALQREHSEIEAVLAEAAAPVPPGPDWPRRLLEAVENLREHILKEQDGLFPAALSILDSSAWTSVEAIRAKVGSEVSSNSTPGVAHRRHGEQIHGVDADLQRTHQT
ncbi:hemerythrin domain-containing protein [Pedococcus ginsenosidimutans]|uniref:Hemerythrin domain-containing protein n=1 Tax=Pedococcus ginsenosidimutans TaxID=490570 RepID=A0ABP8XW30_9MICO